jgi:hypothetical protein
VSHFIRYYAERHYAEYRYAECRGTSQNRQTSNKNTNGCAKLTTVDVAVHLCLTLFVQQENNLA